MGRFLTLIALIAVISTASCPGPDCVELDSSEGPLLPGTGAWELQLELTSLSGACHGLDTQRLVTTRLQAELSVVDDRMVHLDIEDVHMEGVAWREQLFAEGWFQRGFVYDQDRESFIPLGLTLDAWQDHSSHFEGELLMLIERGEATCELIAHVSGDQLGWSEGQVLTCEVPVPLDDDTPLYHPEEDDWDETWECD